MISTFMIARELRAFRNVKLDKKSSIDISGLPAGVYVIRCSQDVGVRAKRFVIAR